MDEQGRLPSRGATAEREELRRYLLSFDLWQGAARAEGVAYLHDSFERLLTTLELVPPQRAGGVPARLLELGANPYFTTLLLKRFRPGYELHLANWFGPHVGAGEQVQEIASAAFGERHRFAFAHFNVEADPFPYPDARFDVVLCCEIIEHLNRDPARMLAEIRRVLVPGGTLLLTTPNVLRLQNLLGLAFGRNVHDAYSGYGPYGRHNREYTAAELADLVGGCGFAVRRVLLEEIAPHRPLTRPLRRLFPRWRDNIYLVAEAAGPPRVHHPAGLYRSFHEAAPE